MPEVVQKRRDEDIAGFLPNAGRRPEEPKTGLKDTNDWETAEERSAALCLSNQLRV